jgi:hypothetical protein
MFPDEVRTGYCDLHQAGAIGNWAIRCGQPPGGRIQPLEGLPGDGGDDSSRKHDGQSVFVHDQASTGFLDRLKHNALVPGRVRPQVPDLDVLQAFNRFLAGINQRPPFDDGERFALREYACLAQRGRIRIPGPRPARLGTVQQRVVLEEGDRIFASQGSAQQSGRIFRIGLAGQPPAQRVGVDRLARDRVPRVSGYPAETDRDSVSSRIISRFLELDGGIVPEEKTYKQKSSIFTGHIMRVPYPRTRYEYPPVVCCS